MTTLELLDLRIKQAEDALSILKGQAHHTLRGLGMDPANAHHEPKVQHAHGYLNALADLRTELIARGLI